VKNCINLITKDFQVFYAMYRNKSKVETGNLWLQYACGGGIEKLPFAVEEIGFERLLHLVHCFQLLNNLKK
jgi:hypothetical protein